jgi:hypothetical protein
VVKATEGTTKNTIHWLEAIRRLVAATPKLWKEVNVQQTRAVIWQHSWLSPVPAMATFLC